MKVFTKILHNYILVAILLVGLSTCKEEDLVKSLKNQEDLIRDELKLMNEEIAVISNRTGPEPAQEPSEQEDESLDIELVSTTTPNVASTTNLQTETAKSSRSGKIASIVRAQLKKEMRKLKSSMTDSIMEEVINYYGKRLDSIDGLKEELTTLNGKFDLLSQNMNSLGQNFKTISRNHRNLVDVVRNNLLNKNEEKGGIKNRKNAQEATIINVLKKKSIDANKTTNQEGGESLDVLKNRIKEELLKELESKYGQFKLPVSESPITDSPTESTTMASIIKSSTTETVVYSEYSIPIKKSQPTDCQDLKNEGIVQNDIYEVIAPKSNKSIYVYCEFEDNIGWTVLQRRVDGTVSFYQNWNAYKNGFGNLEKGGEFWLGLDNMNLLTSQNNYSVQIEMTDWKDEVYVAEYASFKVDDEKSKYKLRLGGYRREASNAGDSLGDELNAEQSHNGMPFSTFDSDNDMRFYDNCAQLFKSGWWFNQCFNSNLNGIYYHYSNASNKKRSENNVKSKSTRHEENAQLRFLRNGIHWNSIDFYKSLKSTKLRIRRTDS